MPDAGTGDASLIRRELVRLATLAPSSHNTQCWKFRVADDAITILPDLSRRCPVVDPDDHHVFVSLGCAAENMVHAALASGLQGQPVAVFASDVDDKTHWVEAGRCYERFALQATALGIKNAMVNQPVEVTALRPQFAAFLGIGARRPDLVVRFGRGPSMPRSLRRPVQAVLV